MVKEKESKMKEETEDSKIMKKEATDKHGSRSKKKSKPNPETESLERSDRRPKRKREKALVYKEENYNEDTDEDQPPRKAAAKERKRGKITKKSEYSDEDSSHREPVVKKRTEQKEEKHATKSGEEKVKNENAETNLPKKEISYEKPKPTKMKKSEDEPVPRPIKYESLGDGPAPVPKTGRKYMGCHVSGAGGVWNAFANAEECSAKSFALFLRSQRQWKAKPLEDKTVEKWEVLSKDSVPHLVLPHGSYLMNLGSPNEETLAKSRDMLVEELQRCQRLGIPHYNFHPGSTTGLMSRVECCKLIAEGINLALRQTDGVICVLENMCCQGFTIGGDFHELRLIIEHVEDRSRVGVCLDTCHALAAGYDLSKEEGFQKLVNDFENIIGWQFLRGLHINDSKGKPGDHLDRHENIGKGTIGIEGFRRIMNCSHFNDLPLILETPWTSNKGYAKEIKILEALIHK